jgi:hypothetical protein
MTNKASKKGELAKRKSNYAEQKPKIIIKYEPSPTFEDEFLEFIEEVLSWPTAKPEQKSGPNATH